MASFIDEAITSVVKNSFQYLEFVIIDDGSTDDTTKLIKGFKKKTSFPIRYHQVSHRGKSACINEVFKDLKINGKYIVFMDADDILPKDSLKKRYEAIESSEVEMVIGEFAVTDLEGSKIETRKLDISNSKKDLFSKFFYSSKTPFHLNSTIISKELLLKTGPFDDTLVRGQEVDYSIRLLKSVDRIKILPEVVYHYRKYYRPLTIRLRIRMQTIRYRWKWIYKHSKGLYKIGILAWQTMLDGLKLVYELFRRYK